MPNPNNNKHFNDEALRINRALKKENDKLKEEIQKLQEESVPYSEAVDKLGTEFEESWDDAMDYAHHVMSTPEFEKDIKEWLDNKS